MGQKLKYIAYCRKSSEDGREKQALSIPAQIDEIKKRFSDLDITFIDESKSAFDIGRPAFNQVMESIRSGKYGGLIAWHPDRLSRNPIDASTIIYYLDKGYIKDLKFCSYQFTNDPEGKMFLNFTLGQSKYFSDKLSKDVTRGLEKRVRDGFLVGPAPIGYLNSRFNEKGKQEVRIDPDRFELVRKLWELLLTGQYTVPQLQKKADEEFHLTTLKRKRIGGTPISRSGLYAVFVNPFYYGEITWNGMRSQGKHQPMITPEEFDRAQEILGRKGKSRPQIHKFAYTGMLKCGECGAMVTAENKKKLLATGLQKTYKLYHCSHRKKDTNCRQGSVTEDHLETLVKGELDKITIPEKFQEWAVEYLHELNEKEVGDRSTVYKSVERKYSEVQERIDRLTQALIKGLVEEEEYKQNKDLLLEEKSKLKIELDNTDRRANDWLEMTLELFDFATHAKNRFDHGSLEEKKSIVAYLGSNYVLKDKKLTLEVKKPFVLISGGIKNIKAANPRFELNNISSQTRKKHEYALVRSSWLYTVADVRAIVFPSN